MSVTVGSTSRTYILHVPSAYKGTTAVPLVVDFHPLGGSGSSEEGSSPYKGQTDPEGVVTAYPNGLSGPSGGAWNVGPCCVANVDDVAFARALVAQVETKACIDTKRVYAVGFSMGGGMSHYVACHAADLFAAVAPASFDLLKENEAGCTPPRPIAEISFRSSNDPLVRLCRRCFVAGLGDAGHLPGRGGHVPEVGRASTAAPARRRPPTATPASTTTPARRA